MLFVFFQCDTNLLVDQPKSRSFKCVCSFRSSWQYEIVSFVVIIFTPATWLNAAGTISLV